MKDKPERSGSEVFIVDSSDETWEVLQYLPDWCQLSEAMDLATVYFEMGSLLRLGDAWQQVNRLRLLMGDEVTRRRKTAFEEGLKCATERLDGSIAPPPLRWPEDDGEDAASWIKAWAKAFDKEPLTRECFKRFDKAPELIQSDLLTLRRLDSAEAYSRAQLLLERLLFLYFLQNRVRLIQQRGYLLSQFELRRDRPEEFTCYEEFPETLFWTLASALGPGSRLDGFPFLNGGLFDDDKFEPSPRRRQPNPSLRIHNATFAQVFDNLLEAFRFTVREDTSLNQDVAVDPEMLGKVFESIVPHAEAADPDAVAPDKRKATGSHYTPRIVVHFICREALLQYLLTHVGADANPPDAARDGEGTGGLASTPTRLRAVMDIDATDGLDAEEIARLRGLLTPAEGSRLRDLLQSLKCCDPAVAPGAFPVGLLHELVNLRGVMETAANGFVEPVRKHGNAWIHTTKAHVVENCLYGVDIQQQAIEICRLRLWLSLVVDYDIGVDPWIADRASFHHAIKELSTLPKLEMDFKRGDSLLDQISGIPVRIQPDVVTSHGREFKGIQKLGADLHHAQQAEKKRRLRVEILRQRLNVTELALAAELEQLLNQESGMLALFEEIDSPAEKRRRIAEEKERVQEALNKVTTDRKDLEKLAARPFHSSFYPKLRRLEGADFSSPSTSSGVSTSPTSLPRHPPLVVANSVILRPVFPRPEGFRTNEFATTRGFFNTLSRSIPCPTPTTLF